MATLLEIILIVPALVIAITVHEFSHGWVANSLGDPTPKNAGRLTLNPLRHLDPLGSLLIFIVRFGWGKPMPVNPRYFSNPKMGMMWVSLAGPLSNLITAFFFGMALRLPFIRFSHPLIVQQFFIIAQISIYLAIFNLIPIPPLDGSKILAVIIPRQWTSAYLSFERYGTLVLFLIIFFFWSSFAKIISPVFQITTSLLLPR
jgi:Zn-dependent protease